MRNNRFSVLFIAALAAVLGSLAGAVTGATFPGTGLGWQAGQKILTAVGGIYSASPAAMSDNDTTTLYFDSAHNLKVTAGGSGVQTVAGVDSGSTPRTEATDSGGVQLFRNDLCNPLRDAFTAHGAAITLSTSFQLISPAKSSGIRYAPKTIWFTNTGATARVVTIASLSDGVTYSTSTQALDDSHTIGANGFIVFNTSDFASRFGEAVYAKQSVGADVVVSGYGWYSNTGN